MRQSGRGAPDVIPMFVYILFQMAALVKSFRPPKRAHPRPPAATAIAGDKNVQKEFASCAILP